jgi:hypothetical protein
MYTNIPNKFAAYAATVTLLGGGAAHAAIVYQSFETTLSDPSTTDANSAATIGSILFDGTTITIASTTANGGATFSAIDNYTLSGQAKVAGSSIQANGGYVQTPGFLNAGDVIGEAFTQTLTFINFPTNPVDSKDNLYLGISTPDHRYGWVRFGYTNAGKTITIHDVAFQTAPNTPITAGVSTVPEASSFGLVALAGGAAALRRKRKIATDA